MGAGRGAAARGRTLAGLATLAVHWALWAWCQAGGPALTVAPAPQVDLDAPITWLTLPPSPVRPPAAAPDRWPIAAPEPPPIAVPALPTSLEAPPPDRPALPLTAPDFDGLQAWANTGADIALQLQIDAQGQVTRVDVLQCAEADRAFAEAVAQVLRRTPHMPARRAGQDVASVKRVVLSFGA